RRADCVEGGACQVGTAATRHDCLHLMRAPCGGNQCGSGASARSKESDGQRFRQFLMTEPVYRIHESTRQQLQVEAQLARSHIHGFLLRRQQIQKQRCEAGLAQCVRDESVAGTEAAGPASMREEDNAARESSGGSWNSQRSPERYVACRYMNSKLAR